MTPGFEESDTQRTAEAQKLAPELLAELSRLGVARQYRERALLVTEGELTDSLYIILEGRVRAFVSEPDGREAVLSVMGPGEYFGEVALDDGPRSASVVTLEPCRLIVVPKVEFAQFLAGHPAFAQHFVHSLLRRIRILTQSVRSLALMDAYGRVARLLLESSVRRDGVQFVPERPTQADIASRVGCTREMVSRILKDLVASGHIVLQPDRIVINRKPPARP
jgi:CRP/FNR family cyclic AMP-dependent transcriptional regulator